MKKIFFSIFVLLIVIQTVSAKQDALVVSLEIEGLNKTIGEEEIPTYNTLGAKLLFLKKDSVFYTSQKNSSDSKYLIDVFLSSGDTQLFQTAILTIFLLPEGG